MEVELCFDHRNFRGKPIDPEKEGFVHFIGFVLLIGLMIVVTYSDIIRFNLFRR